VLESELKTVLRKALYCIYQSTSYWMCHRLL